MRQTSGNYNISWNNPAATRALTIEDPLGSDTFAYLAASQTISNKILNNSDVTNSSISTGSSAFSLVDLSIRSSASSFDLYLANAEVLTTHHTLTFKVNNGDLTIDLGSNLKVTGAITSLTLTTTGTTDVTFPLSRTLATLAGGETFTNKTLTDPIINAGGGTIVLPVSAAPSQTDDGSIVWDSDDNLLTVVDGSSRKILVDITSTQTLTSKTLTTPTISSFINATHNHLNAAGGGLLSIAAVSGAISLGQVLALPTAMP